MLIQTLFQLFIAILVGIVGFAAGAGLTGSLTAATFLAFLCATITGIALRRSHIVELDSSASTRGLQILSALAMLCALVQLIRLTVFIVEPSQVSYSMFPSSDWEARHSCATAYFEANRLSPTVPDIYASALYALPDDDPALPRKPRLMGFFRVDAYEYPPPFLLLPHIISWLAPDFLDFRMVWFSLNIAGMMIAILVIARSLGPLAGTRALLLSPLIWAAWPTINTLQKGNIQILIIAISILAMALLAKRRFASGGAILAFAAASKIYPGMLVVYLLARRQWRAVAWTTVSGIAFLLLTFLITGWPAYQAFLKHLPGLLGGEAFPAFRNPSAMGINFSIPGIIFKLKLFGVAGMGFGASKIVGWVYTLVLLGIVGLAAQRANQQHEDSPLIWVSILLLATLRSPFLPQAYAGIPGVWLLTLVGGVLAPRAKTVALIVLVWFGLNIMVPMDWGFDPRMLALITAVPQFLTLGIAVYAIRGLLRPSHHLSVETVQPNLV